MKNQDTWKAANNYAANLMYKLIWGVLAFVQIPSYLFLEMEDSVLVSVVGIVVAAVAVIPLTEIHLKKIFKPNGEWRKEYVE